MAMALMSHVWGKLMQILHVIAFAYHNKLYKYVYICTVYVYINIPYFKYFFVYY